MKPDRRCVCRGGFGHPRGSPHWAPWIKGGNCVPHVDGQLVTLKLPVFLRSRGWLQCLETFTFHIPLHHFCVSSAFLSTWGFFFVTWFSLRPPSLRAPKETPAPGRRRAQSSEWLFNDSCKLSVTIGLCGGPIVITLVLQIFTGQFQLGNALGGARAHVPRPQAATHRRAFEQKLTAPAA